MITVAQVLQNKKITETSTITSNATVLEAITLMSNKGIGAVVVVDSDRVVGILSERDYTRKIALMQRTSDHTTVAEIMTSKVLTVGRSHTVDECLGLMTERHIRHLPVLDNDQLIGVISIGDLVKATMEQQKTLIDQLQQYISS